MRVLAVALVGLGMALGFGAQADPVFPKGAKALEAQLLASEDADARAFIKDEAQREATTRFVDEETPRNAARKYGATGSDVSKLAFLILMEASRATDANVSDIVNGVQGADASRQDLRQEQATDNVIAGTQQSQLSGGQQMAAEAQGHAFLPLLSSNQSADDNSVTRAMQGPATPRTSMNLQDAMDRENQIDDLLEKAMKQVTNPA
ncbi:MAG TPA: hypothetical protein VL971_07070 [Rhizomicrobium sp.]|nr:hypothetical protein [Rhizomicrobium sp.]